MLAILGGDSNISQLYRKNYNHPISDCYNFVRPPISQEAIMSFKLYSSDICAI